jgi:PAS domain S-box-containing protein
MHEGPGFLAGGEMGALMRAHDWAATPLGPPEAWPQGLRTAVRMALTTRHPIFIFWGEQHVCLYNDGYRPSLGPEKHPSMLGARGREAWAEIWPIIGPQIELVLSGEGATWRENQLVPIVRHGGLQEVYWTYSYGPIDDETAPNGVGGVLVVCTETTAQVLAERRAAAGREHLAAMFQQAPGFICTLRGPDHVFEFVNDEHRRLFNSADWLGKRVREAFPDIAGQGFYELLDRVYATGERVVVHGAAARFRLTPDAPEREMLLDFVYAPTVDESGAVTGIYCSGYDVTDQRRAEAALRESEAALREAQRLAHIGSWTWSAATDVTIGSPELYRICGLDPDKDRFPDFRDQRGVLYPVESWETINAAVQRSVATEVGYELDVEALRGSEPIWITTRCEVVRDGGNQVVGLRGTVQDITERKRAERAEAEQSRLLELVAAGQPLDECLTAVTAAVAKLEPSAWAGILVADAEGKTFRHVHAADIPPSFGAGLKDAPIDELAIGTCGEAVYSGRPVTCPDIANDERWSRPWRELCVAHGILGCHSEPVRGADGRCLGSLMLCFGEARQPSEWERRTAAFGVRIAGVAIERDRAGQALRESEARFREVAEVLPQFVWACRADGTVSYVNWRWTDYSGLDLAATADPERLAAAVHPGERAALFGGWEKALSAGEPFETEARLRRKDGGFRWFLIRTVPLRDGAGRVARWFGASTDIQDIVEAREVLARSRAELQRLADESVADRERLWALSDDLVVTADYEGRLIRVSPSWTHRLGWDEATLLTMPYRELIHPDDFPAVMAALLGMRDANRPVRFEDRVRHADGSWRWIQWALSPDPGGALLHGVGRDVTAEKEAAAELARAQEQLRQAQKMEAIGQLTGGVAHDFNNLLTVVAGGLRLLERQPDPERRRRVLDGMGQAVERGAGLTRQLLAFGRRQALNPEPVDLACRAGGMRDMLARSLRGDIRVEIDIAAGAWPVEVDAAELELALLNLCVNARDAMADGGVIRVTVENAPGTGGREDLVRLSVKDTGAGMPPEVLARALEPFFTTKEVGKGSGLGLAQVYGFAKQSGGDVEIASDVGRGTTVTITLPRSAKAPRPEPQEAVERPVPDGAAGHVLLVEDDEEVAALTGEMLDSLGFEVTRVASAAAALGGLADGRAVDVVFSDVMMPGGSNGLDLAREVRRRRPDLPVVLTTGFENAARGAKAEGFDLLLKPYHAEAVSAMLRARLADARRPGRG